ncbi:MAG: CHASE4 domain-containing protein, partial [Sneathiella sp.]
MNEDRLIQIQLATRRRIKQLILPLLVFVIGAFGLIFFGIWNTSKIQDEQAIDASKHFLASLLEDKMLSLQSVTADYAYWDISIKKLVVEVDDHWAEKNIGAYLQGRQGFVGSYVLNNQNRTIYAAEHGKKVVVDFLQSIPAAEPVIAQLRSTFKSNPLGVGVGSYILKPNGKSYILTASIITPDYSEFTKEEGAYFKATKFVLVHITELNTDFFTDLANRFSFSGLKINRDSKQNSDDTAILELRSISQESVGWVTWVPKLQGAAFVSQSLKSFGFAIVFLFALIAFIAVRTFNIFNIFDKGSADYEARTQKVLDYEQAISGLAKEEFLDEKSMINGLQKI